MRSDVNKLKRVWEAGNNTAIEHTTLPKLSFEEIVSSITSTGPFYFYVIDFFDMSLSNVSPSIFDIHGFDPKTVTFDDILHSIHPDDMEFVSKAEAINLDFIYNTLGSENICRYKSSYSFRSKMKDGEYAMLNHQALILTVDENGGFGKSLNIHTRIDHLTKTNTNQVSLIGLQGLPSFMNMEVSPDLNNYVEFTSREIEIIKCIAAGNPNKKIAESLSISEGTVKKHRNNINQKSGCKNSVELVNKSLLQGLI